MSRQQFLFYFFTAAVLFTAVYFFLPKTEQPVPEEFNEQSEPSAYMFVSSNIRYDKSGNISYKMSSEKVRHYEAQKITVLYKPRLDVPASDTSQSWKLKSRSGQINGNQDTIELKEKVNITNFHSEQPAVVIQTEKLTLYPEKQFVETDQLVTVTHDTAQMKSTGMTLDMKENRLEFLSNVKGVYDPAMTKATLQ